MILIGAGLFDITVGMTDTLGRTVVAYERTADRATITFDDGTVHRVGLGYRLIVGSIDEDEIVDTDDDDEITAMTEVGEEAIEEMVAVKCVGCGHVVTNRATMARMWCVDTCCPKCGDGALLWDDGSLGYTL